MDKDRDMFPEMARHEMQWMVSVKEACSWGKGNNIIRNVPEQENGDLLCTVLLQHDSNIWIH